MPSNFIQIFFAKPPLPGYVKTRLAKFTGDLCASKMYESILRTLFQNFIESKAPFQIWSSTSKNNKLIQKLLPKYKKIYIQNGNDLGERMAHAFIETSKRNPNKNILLCGTDIPDYSAKTAFKAEKLLEKNDVVIGPSYDGGYYLIAINCNVLKNHNTIKSMFTSMTWSHENVLSDQLHRVKSLGFKYTTLNPLHDLDVAQDLLQLKPKNKKKLFKFLPDIRIVIPVLNEIKNIKYVIEPLKKTGLFSEIIVADNGSTDGTPTLALKSGARVTHCPKKGYGATCLTAIRDIQKRGGCDVVLFMDGDGSDDSQDILSIIGPVVSGQYDFCLGKRTTQLAKKGALKPHQIFGNKLAVFLIWVLFQFKFHDLGPMRAINYSSLIDLNMDDQNFGWTIQMQIRSVIKNQRIKEIPVHYKNRYAGRSKVASTIKGSIQAGIIIIKTVFKERFF